MASPQQWAFAERPASCRTNSCKRVHLHDFERHVHQHKDRVYGFACRMLGSRDDARDVTQDVLIRLWQYQEAIDDVKVLPWLMRVTRNACIDVLRHRKMVHDLTVNGAEIEKISHDGLSPSEQMERDDDRRLIESALEGLSEPYRSIVELREIQHLKYEEISGAMDMPMNTVKVYLHRGRKMLRQKLTEVIERERV